MQGTASPQTQPVLPPHTQLLAGTAFPQTKPPQTQPLPLQAIPEKDLDDEDYEDFDSRAAVGEQSFEEETAQAEEAGSEAEEIAFKLKVAAIARKEDKQIRYGKKPYHRFRSAVGGGGTAVGGGGAAALLDMVHNYALQVGAGIEFTLDSVCAIDESGRRFVAVQNNLAQGSKFELLEREQEAFRDSSQGGWCLFDELPDTDFLSGTPMSEDIFTSRWQRDYKDVFKHLLKNTRGNWLSCRVGG